MRTTKKRGFTLIELMIVIAIIAIIAAIAIPNLLDARKAANEASAIAGLRAWHSAQNVYREQDKDGNGTLDYANPISAIVELGLIDWEANDNDGYTSSGYLFEAVGTNGITMFKWCLMARPEESGESGDRGFFIDQTGVIRYTASLNMDAMAIIAAWPAIGK